MPLPALICCWTSRLSAVSVTAWFATVMPFVSTEPMIKGLKSVVCR
jgi:hypothetical protein